MNTQEKIKELIEKYKNLCVLRTFSNPSDVIQDLESLLVPECEWISVDYYIFSIQEFHCIDEHGQQLIGYIEKDIDRFDFESEEECFICEKNGVILDNIKYFKPLPKPPEQ